MNEIKNKGCEIWVISKYEATELVKLLCDFYEKHE